MNRLILCLLFLCLNLSLLQAKPIGPETAQKVANQAFTELSHSQGLLQLTMVQVAESNGGPLYYTFSYNGSNGFIIIAGDDASIPVLAYSVESNYTANPSPSFVKWMEWYKLQIREIREQHLEADDAIREDWEHYLNPVPSAPIPTISAVNPLLSSKWNQGTYYNSNCPYDNNYNQRTVTGCVATAMAQLMKFWEYPAQGTGNHSYNHSSYGTLSANFAATSYNWSGMPNTVSSSNSAVATLMYHCGVSVDMNYGVGSQGGSGAYVISSRSPVTHCSEYAFKTYFGYDPGLSGEERASYTQTQWIQKLKDELDAGRPMLYAGFGQGGHAFVCDGYDNSNYFHFNWGWGGLYDGYFSINSLNPGTGGAGAGAGTYNNGQQAIFNLKPKNGGGGNGSTSTLELYSSITISPNPVTYLGAFSVSVQIANSGNAAVTGDFGAAVFNSDGEFIDFVDVIEDGTLNAQSYANATFNTTGMSDLIPGQYIMGIYFKQGSGDWNAIDEGSYTNFINFNVAGTQGDIRLFAAVDINPNPVKQNQALTVTFDMANYHASKTFNGSVSIDLHKSDGTWIRELAIKDNLSLPPQTHFTNGLTYSISGLPEDPGDYKLQIWYLPDGGDWELMGSGAYSNPVALTIITPGLNPDSYETNNTEGNARSLSVNFSGNTAGLKTTGSNIHNGTDLDYYKLELDPGYDYTITGRVHDAYSSGNGQTYTCDVTLAYQQGGKWSDYYDDILTGTITVQNGGTLLFNVSPYFTGQTGTYLLDLTINRVKRNNTFVSIPLKEVGLKAYPNPVQAGETTRIETDRNLDISALQLFTAEGKALVADWKLTDDGRVELGTRLVPGIYFVKVFHSQGCSSLKLVVE